MRLSRILHIAQALDKRRTADIRLGTRNGLPRAEATATAMGPESWPSANAAVMAEIRRVAEAGAMRRAS